MPVTRRKEGSALRCRAELCDAAAGLAELASPRQSVVQSSLGTCRYNFRDKDEGRRSRQFRRRTFARSLLFRGAFPGNFLTEIFCILRIADGLVVRTATSSICRQQLRLAGRPEDSNFSHREICILRGGRPYQHDIAAGGFLEIHRNTSIITGGADFLKRGEHL